LVIGNCKMFGLNYFFYKALSLFIMPLGIALVLLIAALLFLLYKRRMVALFLLFFIAAWMWLWSTPMWSNFLCGKLESQYPWKPANQYPVAEAIVVLGGGIRGDAGPGLPSLDLNAAADRELFASRLYHAGRSKVIVVSGGVDPISGTGVAGVAMKQFLVMLGVPAEAIRVEGRSKNTVENAIEVQRMMGLMKDIQEKETSVNDNQRNAKSMDAKLEKVPSILLVTSAQHMPRAFDLFARTGLRIIPAPADFQVVRTPFSINLLLPEAEALRNSTNGWKEFVGRWISKR
jgi:uncharacterized SAM-binding protein YcdF (DUF218 family)